MQFEINGKNHMASAPKMKDWRIVQRFKTERRERAEELKSLFDSLGSLDDGQQAEVTLNNIEQRVEANKRLNIDTKIHILSEVFDVDFEDVGISAVHEVYTKYEDWIDDLVSGKLAKFPNEKTQTVE